MMSAWWRFRIAGMVFLSSLLLFLVPLSFGAIGASPHRAQPLPAESHSLLQNPSAGVPQSYVSHTPIRITNNTDFARYGFPGIGTEEQPYLIEGLNITMKSDSEEIDPLIEIQYSTVYFRIQNNLLDGLTRESYGIYLDNVVPGTIDSNIITNCYWGIINWSENNTIIHNTVSECEIGISIRGRNNSVIDNTVFDCENAGIESNFNFLSTIAHNTVSHCQQGIYFENSRLNTIANNIIFDCGAGIHLYDSPQNTLIGNRLINNGLVIAILLDKYSSYPKYSKTVADYLQATVAENVVNDRPVVFWQNMEGGTVPPGAGQVILLNCTGVEVMDQDLTGVSTGVFAAFCTHLTIHHNTVAECGTGGIFLHISNQSTVADNIISKCRKGINLSASKNISVADNNVFECKWGITLENLEATKTNNTLIHNTVAECERGIYLTTYSGHNTMIGNQLVNNGLIFGPLYGVGRYGFYYVSVKHYFQATVAENVVNGHPLVFWQNVRGDTVPPGAGQVILLNCSEVEVTRGIISQVSTGVFAAFCSHLTIHHNIITACGADGILLHVASQNTVTHNNLSHNGGNGIHLQWGSSQNIISNNNLSHNSGYGIFLDSYMPSIEPPPPYGPGDTPINNTMRWNTFSDNNPGGFSQAYDTGQNTVFVQNYWEGHNNIDRNDDRIVDIPYPIEGGTTDPSPLVEPASAYHLFIPTIIHPQDGETLQGTVTTQWLASNDSLGHSITYTISYSPDDGRTWIQLASGLASPEYEWDTTTVANGSSYRIHVVATCSDEYKAEDRSDAPFTILNQAPTTTSLPLVGAFSNPREFVGILLANLLLVTISVRLRTRKSR